MSETVPIAQEEPHGFPGESHNPNPALVLRIINNPLRQPQLTDDELIRIRAMLEAFDTISHNCPVARRVLAP